MSLSGKLAVRLTISYEEDHVLCLSDVWLNIQRCEKCLSAFVGPEVSTELTPVSLW